MVEFVVRYNDEKMVWSVWVKQEGQPDTLLHTGFITSKMAERVARHYRVDEAERADHAAGWFGTE